MAASLSAATFVGCDLSAAAIQIARDAVNHSGLANVTLVHGDLRELSRDLGPFDFIVAHGVYSWVPPSVRDGLFSLAHERLAPNGLMFVSYNVYPGCHVRQAVWEALRFHAGNLESAHDRLDAARALAGALADPARVQDENDATRAGTVLRLRLPAALPSKRSLPRRAGSRDRMDAAERAVHACGRLALADPRGGAIATAAQSEPTRGARGQRIDEYVRQFARLGLLIG
jgi:SAM-dependent methyltransferase